MKSLIVWSLMALPIAVFAQDAAKAVVSTQIFQVVEQMPSFPGGQKAMEMYFTENMKYPAIAKDNDVEGTVYVKFVVTETGKITNTVVVRPIDKYLELEAIRLVNGMPDWKPGMQNGKAVNVYYTVPVKFKLK